MKREMIAKPACEHKAAGDVMNTNYVICTECHNYIAASDLADVWTKYHALAETGLAILMGELEQHRKEAELAAGELMVTPIPRMDSEDQRDVDIRTMMRANSLMRRERDQARMEARELRARLSEMAHNVIMVHEEPREDRHIGEIVPRRYRLETREDPAGLVRKAHAVLQDLKR